MATLAHEINDIHVLSVSGGQSTSAFCSPTSAKHFSANQARRTGVGTGTNPTCISSSSSSLF